MIKYEDSEDKRNSSNMQSENTLGFLCCAQEVISAIQPRLKEGGKQTMTDFISDRFEFYADNHHSAIIAGSTYAADLETTATLLDAIAIGASHDSLGIRTCFSQATADGLGHLPEENARLSIGKVANYVSENFVKHTLLADENKQFHEVREHYIGLGKSSKQAAVLI